jgi:hypothetical protein
MSADDDQLLKEREREIHLHDIHDRTNVIERTCGCELTSYYSGIYRTFVPCCHFFRSGLTRPHIPVPPVFIHSTDGSEILAFSIDLEEVGRPGEEPSFVRKDSLIDLAARSIKQLSRTGVGLHEIRAWLTANFLPSDEMVTFIQNVPLPVLRLISVGVMKYGDPPSDRPATPRGSATLGIPS